MIHFNYRPTSVAARPILLLSIFLTICSISAIAQINVTGTVIDRETDETLAGASVMIRDEAGKIRKFSTSKANGSFTISIADISGCRIEATMIGFEKKSVSLDSIELPARIYLSPGSIKLKEVAIKADRIREQGDTVSYTVGAFAQKQDRSIGDVLKRMPGIDVEQNGRIKYQGEDINRFYIEGSDLLGGKYGIATNGINHDDVGAVEVMENHQPMQVLSGISFSDKAAINLKLKNKAKATWSIHGSASGGYSGQPEGALWNGELFAMAVMPSFQSIMTIKGNNTGANLSAQTTDFFANRRSTDLSRYINIGLPGTASLQEKRTLFNRSAMISGNSLWKTGSGELKAQIDYAFNRIISHAANITTYILNDGNRIITEERDGRDRNHALSGKLIYESNRKTAYINNTLQTNIDWDNVSLRMSGSIPNQQSASLPDYYLANRFKMIKRFSGKHLITFQSINEWESLPQTLSVGSDGRNLRQHIGDHAFFTQESAAYAFSFKGITISLEGGLKGYLRKMDSEGSIGPDRQEETLSWENVVNTNYLTLYATPKLEYWIKRVSLTLNAPLSYARYSFDKAIADRQEIYFSPSLSMNWKPNNRIQLGIRGGTGRSPMPLNMIHSGMLMTDYRTFNQGTDDFYTTTSQNLSANLSYKHTRMGLFGNAFASHGWSHRPYTMVQQLVGDYAVYSYSPAKSNGQSLMLNGKIGKTLDFIRGSMSLSGRYQHFTSHLISENENVASNRKIWSIAGSINGTPARWLSIAYSIDLSASRLAMNGYRNPWLRTLQNELQLTIIPHRKWEWSIMGEHYHNEITYNQYKNILMVDTKLVFRLSKRVEMSALLSNILNHKTYSYTTYNALGSFESQRQLRGREFLLTITLRK